MARFRPLIAITGSTGTGKSQLAVEIARAFNGEVVNADALQLYAGLPIATNKISAEEMQGVEHHLLGCVGLDQEPWTIGRFVSEAQNVVSQIHARGKVAVITGGTHYYVQSVLFEDSLLKSEEEPKDSAEQERRWPILRATPEEMMRCLRELDPEAAEWWHPRDGRKIRRSLEVCLESGRKVSEIYREQKAAAFQQGFTPLEHFDSLCFHLHAEREALVERLNTRVDQMMQQGLLEEVGYMRSEHVRLQHLGKTIDETKGIWVAIGYKEFSNYFKALDMNSSARDIAKAKAEGRERTQISTRQYAARQNRWVKNTLVPAVETAGCRDRFFVLDATDRAAWNASVAGPALSVAAQFLSQATLPDPRTVGSAATVFDQSNKAVKMKNTCETCQVTTVTAEQWNQHLKSTKHKSLTRPRSSYRKGQSQSHVAKPD